MNNNQETANLLGLPEPIPLSKRQQKRLRKHQKWMDRKPEKRRQEREKLKQRRAAAREKGETLGPSRKMLKQSTMKTSPCKIRVVVDLSLDDYMTDRDLQKCSKQILRCYSLNRRAPYPMQFYLTSLNGRSQTEMGKNQGYTNWDVYFKEEGFMDVFKKEEIVYLSSESDNLVSDLREDQVYVIGGLVDHNVHKGLCHQRAEELQIAHARLPIDEYFDMKTRKILTIDQVFEILLKVTTGLSWKDALFQVLPERKGATMKAKEDTAGSPSSKEEGSTVHQLHSAETRSSRVKEDTAREETVDSQSSKEGGNTEDELHAAESLNRVKQDTAGGEKAADSQSSKEGGHTVDQRRSAESYNSRVKQDTIEMEQRTVESQDSNRKSVETSADESQNIENKELAYTSENKSETSTEESTS